MKPQDELWWVRPDGEVIPAEAARYDLTPAPEDRILTSDETEMDRKLGEVLARPAPGADDAWLAALAKVKAHEQAQRGKARLRRRIAWLGVPLALAATALLVLSTGYVRTEQPQPWFLKINAQEAAGQVSSTKAQEVMTTARNMLRDRNMRVDLDPKNSLEAADSPYHLVSVHGGEYAGEQVLELFFDCGAQQAKVIITSGTGNAAREISQAVGHGMVQASRREGDWLISVVGTDAPDGLLSLLEAPPVPEMPSTPAEETPQPETSPASPVAEPVAAPAPEASPNAAPEAVQAPPETPIQPEQPSPPTSETPEPAKSGGDAPPVA